jgi:hypothetical protein
MFEYLNCAQTVTKICQENGKIYKNIQKYQKPKCLKNQLSTGVTPYIFCLPFFLCFLHTVEVTGSNLITSYNVGTNWGHKHAKTDQNCLFTFVFV